MNKILCLCLSSTIQRTITFENLTLENVNRSKNFREDASGKAVNSCRVLNQIEQNSSILVCPIGKNNSKKFLTLSKKNKLIIKPIKISGETRECWTLLDSINKTTTELVVNSKNPENFDKNKIENQLLKSIKKQLKKSDAILFAGSKPAYFSENLHSKIAEIIKNSNKIFMADFWGKDLIQTLQIFIPQIIKINEYEFEQTFSPQKKLSTEDLKSLIKEKSIQFKNIIIVTRGTESTFACENGIFYEEEIIKTNAVNTTACGDSFNSGFLHEYLKSKNIKSALKSGTKCASLNAQSTCPGSIFIS